MQITKAVIPAAGLGTRVLPASKAVPKEMLPIVDKPAIQYIVEEAVKSGITDILIITNRGKGVIEDHFDHAVELEALLRSRGNTEMADAVAATAHLANIFYIRQRQTRGLGDAVLRAKQFVGKEPFAVLYGDDVIYGDDPALGQLMRAYNIYGKSVVGIQPVSEAQVMRYSSMKLSPLKDNYFEITDMVEKPKKEQIFSLYSILGRCILEPEIFDILETIPMGAGGELQLTDAMRVLANRTGVVGVHFTGKRFDMGNKFGILEANIEVGLQHPETRTQLRAYLKRLAGELE